MNDENQNTSGDKWFWVLVGLFPSVAGLVLFSMIHANPSWLYILLILNLFLSVLASRKLTDLNDTASSRTLSLVANMFAFFVVNLFVATAVSCCSGGH
jgi:hypothetical protein